MAFMQKYLQDNLAITFKPQHDKTNKMTVHPAKTLISLGNRLV